MTSEFSTGKNIMLRVTRDLILRPQRRKVCTTWSSVVKKSQASLWAKSQEMENRIKGFKNCWVQKERENNSKPYLLGLMVVKIKQSNGEG